MHEKTGGFLVETNKEFGKNRDQKMTPKWHFLREILYYLGNRGFNGNIGKKGPLKAI
jgi:hypothetical protein